MTDKFGRNKSTRWVKASIPTYGDEWGDDYDYDYESGNESEAEHSESQTRTANEPRSSVEEERSQRKHSDVLQLDQYDNRETDANVQAQNPNLVLSIDKLRTRRYASEDSSSEDEEGPEIMDEIDEPYMKKGSEDFVFEDNKAKLESKQPSGAEDKTSQLSEMPINQTITTHDKQYGQKSDLLPPTPTFSTADKTNDSVGETPKSERSYQSDADSIQNEPSDLNIRDIGKFSSPLDENAYSNDIPVESNHMTHEDHPDKLMEQDHEQLETQPDESIMSSNESKSTEAPAPLVLSIDKKKYDDNDNSSDDDWGYNSQKDSDEETASEEEKHPKEFEKPYTEDLNEETDSTRKNKSDALDNLIMDLQNASLVGQKDGQVSKSTRNETSGQDELFLNMDSLQNISLPDFENNSFSHYDGENHKGLNIQNILPDEQEDSQPPTPIAPLTFGDEVKGHEDFVTGLTGHRRSIRKPPPNSTNPTTNRNELVSVDYTNIADAVSGYMNDDGSNKNLDLYLGDSGGARLSNVPETEGDDNENKNLEADLNPTVSAASSGSLSTGSFSFDAAQSASQKEEDSKQEASTQEDTNKEDTNKADDDISRRVSTMSTNTISMGNWKPNTNNYRDQFINDNDNESNINFNPYADSNSNYNNFTKMRTVSGASFDSVSNSSSVSVPETIDAALPSIDEDPDNHDSTINGSDNSLELTKTTNTTDSVLKEHHYHPQVFKEEKVTPISSKDDLGKTTAQQPQKYSSLLGANTGETEDSDLSRTKSSSSFASEEEATSNTDKRLGSTSSGGTTSLSVSKNFTPQPYNLYNWKSIMATSQPIDRIRLLRDALEKETDYDTGLLNWLNESLRQSEDASNIHIGKIATQAYQNAAHNDIRRHASIRSKVSIVRDKVETSGLQASSLGKRFFNRGKKLMKSSGNE